MCGIKIKKYTILIHGIFSNRETQTALRERRLSLRYLVSAIADTMSEELSRFLSIRQSDIDA